MNNYSLKSSYKDQIADNYRTKATNILHINGAKLTSLPSFIG